MGRNEIVELDSEKQRNYILTLIYVKRKLRAIAQYTKAFILSVESQKGINDVQICSIENQKGAITVQSVWK